MSIESPKTVRLWLHYKKLGLDKGWKAERVLRLCQMAELHYYELGRLFCIENSQMDRWMGLKRGFPPYVALHFALLEQWLLAEHHGKKSPPLIPIHLLHD